jgi:hypothetical protein
MGKSLIALAVFGGLVMGSSAQARQEAYCLKTSAGPGDCKYSSFAQCEAARSGVDGACQKNPGVTENGSVPGAWIPHGANERPISEQTTGKAR